MVFKKVNNRIFTVNEDGRITSEIDFEKKAGTDDTYVIFRTFVDNSLRGQGVAGLLVKEAIREIQGRGGKVEATCSYAKEYLNRKST